METENYANQDSKKIERWATDNKIEFNDKKSMVLYISRKTNDDREVDIYLNYKRLDQIEEMKYLGIYLDSKFNFNAHIDHTVAKLITVINMLARTTKLQWGLGHKALKIFNFCVSMHHYIWVYWDQLDANCLVLFYYTFFTLFLHVSDAIYIIM